MSTLATFLMGIAGSLAARILISLGIGIFSYSAIIILASSVVTAVTVNYNSIDSTTLAILNLAGAGQVLGILLAGMTTSASLSAFKRIRPL